MLLATGMSSAKVSGSGSDSGRPGISDDSDVPLVIRRLVDSVAAIVFSSLKATHSVSSMKESTAMAPMSNERCKSIVIESILSVSVSASTGARDQLRPRAMDDIWTGVVWPSSFLLEHHVFRWLRARS